MSLPRSGLSIYIWHHWFPGFGPGVEMSKVVKRLGAGPLFLAGVVSLVTGIFLNTYWAMVGGLLAMAIGSLNITDNWG